MAVIKTFLRAFFEFISTISTVILSREDDLLVRSSRIFLKKTLN